MNKKGSMPARKIKRERAKHQRPNAKGRLNGYMVFCKTERAKVQKERPNLTFTEIGAELGARWRALSQAARDKYNKQAEQHNRNRK